MRALYLRPLAILSLLAFAPLIVMADDPDPEQVVNAFEKLSGVHKGLRRNHAKGACAIGSFVGTAAGAKLSASHIFSDKKVPVVARLSLAGPNPNGPDTAPSPRGMGLQFQFANGDIHQMAMLNVPVFPVGTPAAFYDLLQLDLPDPATGQKDPAKAPAFFGAHPEAKPFLTWMGSHNPPPSYANAAFYSLHSFKFIAKDKSEHWVRWRFEPKAGEVFMTKQQSDAMPAEFLDKDLTARTRKAPLQWDMIVTIGEAGDSIDDASKAWPAGRKEVKAGVLTLTKGGADAVGSCEDVNFDPNIVTAGVETSPDPILAYRSQAYAVSYSRRLEEK